MVKTAKVWNNYWLRKYSF